MLYCSKVAGAGTSVPPLKVPLRIGGRAQISELQTIYVYVYIYVYIYICICIPMCIYIYIYIRRGSEIKAVWN